MDSREHRAPCNATPPIGNPEIVKQCPDTEKRTIRFVGAGEVKPGATRPPLAVAVVVAELVASGAGTADEPNASHQRGLN